MPVPYKRVILKLSGEALGENGKGFCHEKFEDAAKMLIDIQKTGVELAGEKAGNLAGPESRKANGGEKWYGADTLMAAIGQSDHLFTPLQLANYVATLVNGGTRYQPHLLKTVMDYTNTEVHEEVQPTVLNTVEVGVSVVDEEGNTILTNSRQRFINRRALPPGRDEANECELLIYGPDRVTPLPPEMRPVRRTVLGQSFSDQLVWFGCGDAQRAFSVTARSVQRQGGFQGSVLAFSDVTGLVNAVAVKEDFVANVSHELRTPLTSIMGYLDLALEDEDQIPPYVAASLRVALRNSEKLLELVSDLLSAAAGPSSIERVPADLSELLSSSLTSAAPRAEINKVQLVPDFPAELPAFLDPQRISQVIDNLLSNAVKYSPDGGRVTVRAWNTPDSLTFEVSDTGIGMTQAEQAEVFTKFFRSGTSRKAAIPGVGLGLVISKNIVEAHGGTITLQSEAGEGTVFTVRLPLPAR